jgi:hypothetical protein
MSYRAIVADKIRAVLDAAGDDAAGITVYEQGQDLIKSPCIVITPSNPYLVPTTMGTDSSVQVFMDLYIVSNRTSVKDSMDQMEKIRHWITEGIKTGDAPIGRWTQYGSFGSIDVGGTIQAASIVSAMFVAQDT